MNCTSRIFSPPRVKKSRRLEPYYVGVVVLSFIIMQTIGCGAQKIAPYSANAFNTYKNQAAKNDLHIAIQPMTDKQ
jgi:hypothetical protein